MKLKTFLRILHYSYVHSRGNMDLQRVLFYLLSIFLYFAEGRIFRYDYTYYPNIDGWLKIHLIPATWRDAWLTCDLEGAVLASPTDLNMLLAMDIHWKSENTTHSAFYTGVHDTFSKGHFFSIEGVPLEKMPVKWAAGEPDNANNNEDCIAWADGAVADVNCTDLFPYMCFKRKTQDMVMTSCGTIDKDYELSPLTGNCYKFHRHARTWHRAQKTCAAEGGYLAVINSQEEAEHLKKLFDDNYSKIVYSEYKYLIHVGVHDWDDSGVWRTIHGMKIEEAGYAKWAANQPNNVTPGQHCGAMEKSLGYNDLWCDKSVAFICEKSPDSLVDDNFAE